MVKYRGTQNGRSSNPYAYNLTVVSAIIRRTWASRFAAPWLFVRVPRLSRPDSTLPSIAPDREADLVGFTSLVCGNLLWRLFRVSRGAVDKSEDAEAPRFKELNKVQQDRAICLKQNTLEIGDFRSRSQSALGTGALPLGASLDSTT